MTLEKSKSEMRVRLRAVLETITDTRRAESSVRVCERLAQHAHWNDSRTILMFAPTPDELDLWPLVSQGLAMGKIIALPRFSDEIQSYVVCRVDNLEQGIRIARFGIREPSPACPVVPLNQLDLVLVPGVAFDAHGRRLGRGRGFYDRLLAGVDGTKCGIAFDEQMVGEVPAGPLDVHLNCILTPTRWIET